MSQLSITHLFPFPRTHTPVPHDSPPVDSPNDDITIELTLGNDRDTYEPVVAAHTDTSDIVQQRIRTLSQFDALTDDAIATILTVLTSGAFTTNFTTKLAAILLGATNSVLVDWGPIAHPQLTNTILRLTDYTLTPVPQTQSALITNGEHDLTPAANSTTPSITARNSAIASTPAANTNPAAAANTTTPSHRLRP